MKNRTVGVATPVRTGGIATPLAQVTYGFTQEEIASCTRSGGVVHACVEGSKVRLVGSARTPVSMAGHFADNEAEPLSEADEAAFTENGIPPEQWWSVLRARRRLRGPTKAMSLEAAQKVCASGLAKSVLATFAAQNEILAAIPFKKIKGNALRYPVCRRVGSRGHTERHDCGPRRADFVSADSCARLRRLTAV